MVTEYAYAKINLFLSVIGGREDGFHNIKSVMHTVTLHDTLSISAHYSNNTEIVLTSSDPVLPTDDNNLICVSATKYLAKFNISARVQIDLDKKIPIGAGLGGGSADAAATLRALNRIFGLATRQELLEIAMEIGSDVSFCLIGGTAICEGRGEIIQAITGPRIHTVIAIGEKRVSTPSAYRALDELYGNNLPNMDNQIDNLVESFLYNKPSYDLLYNVFENVVDASEVNEIKEILTKNRAEGVLMSGSGPSVFGIFKSEKEAVHAMKEIASRGFSAFYAVSANNGGAI